MEWSRVMPALLTRTSSRPQAIPNKRDLAIIHDLMKAGKVTPVIDKRYSFG
jgi:hypothetical protein